MSDSSRFVPTFGARLLGDGRCRFAVWAPTPRAVELELLAAEGGPARRVPLARSERGVWTAEVDDVAPGTRYGYRLDGAFRPDPASQHQPEGVHGPSAVVEPGFAWTDAGWRGRPLSEWVVYELHVGAFSRDGTFDGVAAQLDRLAAAGVTAIELMPVAHNPGAWNWGYDGVYLYAVQHELGGQQGLKRLVDAAHARGIAVVLDVVYNHLGPEGNYTAGFGPYLDRGVRTPWGAGPNLRGEGSPELRRFLRDNALFWLHELHVDGLRLDAADTLVDDAERHFLAELGAAWDAACAALGREAHLVAEVGHVGAHVIGAREAGGYGLAGQWSDGFHHALHAYLTGEEIGYFRGFGRASQVLSAWSRGWAQSTGDAWKLEDSHQPPPPPPPPGDASPASYVVCIQNHDQVGNRPRGDRLTRLVDLPAQKLALGLTLLGPCTPLVFMGDERGETRPFPFFVDHGDRRLRAAVRHGRDEGMRSFGWGEVSAFPPDTREAFEVAVLDWEAPLTEPAAGAIAALFPALLAARRALRASARWPDVVAQDGAEPTAFAAAFAAHDGAPAGLCVFRLADGPGELALSPPAGTWSLALATSAPEFRGPGAAVPPTLAGGAPVTLALPERGAWLWLSRA